MVVFLVSVVLKNEYKSWCKTSTLCVSSHAKLPTVPFSVCTAYCTIHSVLYYLTLMVSFCSLV